MAPARRAGRAFLGITCAWILIFLQPCGYVPPPGDVGRDTSPKVARHAAPIGEERRQLTSSISRRSRGGSSATAPVEMRPPKGMDVQLVSPGMDVGKAALWTAGAAGTLAAATAIATQQLPLLEQLASHHASWVEDAFLLIVVAVSCYSLIEMAGMQMKCPHVEAKVHTGFNVVATLLALYGVGMERIFRESPGLWWAVLVPIVYGVSNVTMTKLMDMYKGPEAYKRLFQLGQSFTLSFQGIHLLAWSSIYPELYWAVLPFWYWSLKKLFEPISWLLGLLAGEDEKMVESHQKQAFGAFGMTLDAATVAYMAVNFGAAIADNAFMGVYTLRGPEGFFEVSRTLADSAGWGSDHLRMALVKPALGSLVISMAVFLGTLVSRKRLPVEIGLPVSALLSSVGPWLVFFWHRLVDPSEPWLPEFMGSDHWNYWG